MAEAQAWRRGVAGVSAADADALLCAAVNCSSGARATPLHVAAEEGETRRVSALLALGAAPDARDRGGATPLFTACEAGRAGGVAALLAAGASATQRNSAGEAPLYIAALKGHQPCVDALLAHCAATGINWLEQRLYDGDGGWQVVDCWGKGSRVGPQGVGSCLSSSAFSLGMCCSLTLAVMRRLDSADGCGGGRQVRTCIGATSVLASGWSTALRLLCCAATLDCGPQLHYHG